MRPMLLSSALMIGALAPPLPVAAQGADEQDIDPIARQRFQIATELYSRGEFAEAAAEFQRVYDATELPDVLHNVYVAHRDAGQKREAAVALRGYIETADEIPDRAIMEGRLATLEREIAEEDARDRAEEPPPPEPEPQPEPQPEPTGPAPEPVPATPPTEPEGPSLVLPLAIMGGGALLLAGAGVLGLLVMSEQSDLEDSGDCFGTLCIADREDDIDSLSTKKTIADVLLVAGGVTALAGMGLLIVELLSSGGDDAPQVSLGCDVGGCAGAIGASF